MKIYRKILSIIVCLLAVLCVPSVFGQGIQPGAAGLLKARSKSHKGPAQNTQQLVLRQGTAYTIADCKPPIPKIDSCAPGAANLESANLGKCTWSANPWPTEAQAWPVPGIALDPQTGCFFGTAGMPGTGNIQIEAINAKGMHPTVLSVVITPQDPKVVVVTTTQLPPQPVNQSYSETLKALGGTSPYTWTVTGNLPSGLFLDPGGRIYGTPTAINSTTATGTTTVSVVATDSANDPPSSPANVLFTLNAAPDCSNLKYADGKYFNGWFPMSSRQNRTLRTINPNALAPKTLPTSNDVVCFYSTSSQISTLGQVQYLYGIGQGTNTLSADLVSIQFAAPVGMQVSLGTSVTGGGSTSTTTGQASPASAVAALEAGGNFYLHGIYPVYVFNSNSFTFLATLNAKLGFSVNGFAGQSTLSQGTEQYFALPAEIYAAYNAIGNVGGFYADYRGGLQTVPGSFKTAAALPSNVFGLQQASFGISFSGLIRVGAQRYFGPSAAFGAPSPANFNKWHLVVQLSPKGS